MTETTERTAPRAVLSAFLTFPAPGIHLSVFSVLSAFSVQ